jgi:hypothetical protein
MDEGKVPLGVKIMTSYNPSRSTTSVLDAPATETATFSASPLVRLGARLFAGTLDARLSNGVSPVTSRVLAARAHQIATPRFRRDLADAWLDLLIEARRPRSPFDPSVPLMRSSVLGADAQIRALADALIAPITTVRGVAKAVAALRDGSGPLFARGSVSLPQYVEDITAQVSPLSALA